MDATISCEKCLYAELLVKAGDTYSFLSPLGQEVERKHINTILICRRYPPIAGQFPQVTTEDWCGEFEGTSAKSDN